MSTLVVVLGYYVDELFYDNEEFQEEISDPFNFRSIPLVVGVSMYSFEAIGILLNVRVSMEEPHRF